MPSYYGQIFQHISLFINIFSTNFILLSQSTKILGKGGGNLLWGAFAFQEGITLRNHGFFHVKKFWMLQVRKSHFCGISAIFFQCYFMSETYVNAVSDFSGSFSTNHFLKGASLFIGWGLFFSWGDGLHFSVGVPHGEHRFWCGEF